ncbi:MAG TPA: SDR family NAD(P)-dependent oxidoreductase [Acetobacteraceae bacterium]|jgi:nucleoside-diphosphate-sugar epimerase|nr:SDR family NAD(P)-dependent oxidoreductase [Acetobacteraceae bacterium]
MQVRLVVFGLGYCGAAAAAAATADGLASSGITRCTDAPTTRAALAHATHVLSTVPPTDTADGAGAYDPVLSRYATDLTLAPMLRWVGYLSTTGVYGDRGGDWVDETTTPTPESPRSARRLSAEAEWSRMAYRCAVELFRLGGIYGPGRSVFDALRAGRARRIIKPGHAFGRIHRDDIVQAVLAAIHQRRARGVRILHLVDDEPAESAAVIEEAARLLGITPPPALQYAAASTTMTPMERSFWAENRKVSSRATRAALGIAWQHPSYREGLSAILAEERAQGLA